MNITYQELFSDLLSVLCARREEIDATVQAIETDPCQIPSGEPVGRKQVDYHVRSTIHRLYESIELVDAAIDHLSHLAEMRR